MAEGAILIIGPSWIGDMVMAHALVQAVAAQNTGAPIDLLAPAWAASLIARMPEVRQAVAAPFAHARFGLKERWKLGRSLRGRYTTAYVLPGSWKSALVPFFAGIEHRIGYLKEQRYLLLNDIRSLPKPLKRKTALGYQRLADAGPLRTPRLVVDAANQAALQRRFGLKRSFVALMPGAEYGPAKRWPERHYAEFARTMLGRGLDVVILGSKNDHPVGVAIASLAPGARNLCGETQLADAIDLLAAARLAVTNDSGLMHVAASVGTPLVAVFGSTSPDNTPPIAEKSVVVTLRLPCSPCLQRVCPLGHLDCLQKLGPETVLANADRLMGAA